MIYSYIIYIYIITPWWFDFHKDVCVLYLMLTQFQSRIEAVSSLLSRPNTHIPFPKAHGANDWWPWGFLEQDMNSWAGWGKVSPSSEWYTAVRIWHYDIVYILLTSYNFGNTTSKSDSRQVLDRFWPLCAISWASHCSQNKWQSKWIMWGFPAQE